MTAASKLAGFAAALALIFAGAAFAGSRIDAHPGEPSAPKDRPAGGMGAMGAQAGGHASSCRSPA